MVLSSMILAGFLAVASDEHSRFAPAAGRMAHDPTQMIKPGMSESQVERMLGEQAGGTFHFGCGFAIQRTPTVMRLYNRSKLMVLYESGKVTKTSRWQ